MQLNVVLGLVVVFILLSNFPKRFFALSFYRILRFSQKLEIDKNKI